MPIVDLKPPDLTARTDVPKGFAVTPGAVDVDHGSDAPTERPAWSPTFSMVSEAAAALASPLGAVTAGIDLAQSPVMQAAMRQSNTIAAYFAAEDREAPHYKEDGFNPWEAIKGTKYEQFWEDFVDVQNSRHAELVKQRIDREQEDRKTLESLPWYQSIPAQMIAGTLDWPTLLPGGAFVRTAKGGISVLRSALSVGAAAGTATFAQEAALHSVQATRTVNESAVNIGASVFLGGLLGAAGARLLSKAEWNEAVAKLERDLAALEPGAKTPVSAGAAAVEPASLEANTIAGVAAGAVAKVSRPVNPILRLMQSESPVVREVASQLLENSTYLKKNFENVASDPAAETLMQEWNAGLIRALKVTNETHSEYRKAGGKLNAYEFREAVGRAMRRGDEASDPYVTKVAKAWRNEVFEPLKEAAIKAGLLPEDVTVETAASYFSRLWNRNRLVAEEGRFKQIVMDWLQEQSPRWMEQFDKETAERAAKLKGEKRIEFERERRIEREARFGDIPGSLREIADEVFDTLTGKTFDTTRPEFITVKARGPLKERTFNIPDLLVEDFLEHNVEHVGRRYTRIMGADVELANKFGSVDLKDQIRRIHEDYARLREGVTDEKRLRDLDKRERSDVRDIEATRDLLRHGTIYLHPVEHSYARLVRSAAQVNYIRSMGEVVVASLTDALRPAMVHGLMQFMTDVPRMALNLKAAKMSVHEAQLAGNVGERYLAHRLATISEIMDPYSARGPVEKFIENMSNVASKWNGIRIWTDFMKSIASIMTQNRILANVVQYGKIPKKERAYLAFLGIDQSMAERIAAQFAEHGETIHGIRVANTEKWTDRVAVRNYRAAINKDVDSIIVEGSVGDLPVFASTPTGRALFQFKRFALASHQKILLRGLQESQARFLGGVVAMTLMGMFITYVKALSGNRPELQERMVNNPGWWIGEGIDRSGILSVPMELANVFEKASGVNVIKTPFTLWDSGRGMSQKLQNRNLTGTLIGPTAGLIEDTGTVLGIPHRLYEGEDVTQAQKNAAVRLLPFNSYLGIRQIMNYVVNPQH